MGFFSSASSALNSCTFFSRWFAKMKLAECLLVLSVLLVVL